MTDLKISNRKSIVDSLKKYCYFYNENDTVEITEWSNGEGWDITLKDRLISLTYGELEAINFLTKALDYKKDK